MVARHYYFITKPRRWTVAIANTAAWHLVQPTVSVLAALADIH